MIEFLFELSHFRMAKGISPKLRSNLDLYENPVLFDAPDASGRHKYTY